MSQIFLTERHVGTKSCRLYLVVRSRDKSSLAENVGVIKPFVLVICHFSSSTALYTFFNQRRTFSAPCSCCANFMCRPKWFLAANTGFAIASCKFIVLFFFYHLLYSQIFVSMARRVCAAHCVHAMTCVLFI